MFCRFSKKMHQFEEKQLSFQNSFFVVQINLITEIIMIKVQKTKKVEKQKASFNKVQRHKNPRIQEKEDTRYITNILLNIITKEHGRKLLRCFNQQKSVFRLKPSSSLNY